VEYRDENRARYSQYSITPPLQRLKQKRPENQIGALAFTFWRERYKVVVVFWLMAMVEN
jgi:hypothetical protein